MSDANIIKQLLAECRHIAMESLSDDDVPPAIERLATIARIDTGSKVTAIKRGVLVDYVPDGPIEGPRYQWHMRAISGQLLPGEPKRVERRRACWNLIVDGTPGPVVVEAWMKDHGIDAAAINPVCCQIVIPDPERLPYAS